jgi:hypothetical protein
VFPLKIGVHHLNHRFVAAKIAYNDGNLLNAQLLAGMFPSVAGNQLKAAILLLAGDNGIQHTVHFDAVDKLIHAVIVLDQKRVVREIVDLIERNRLNPFRRSILG